MFDSYEITHVPSETKVALLAGGSSSERDISLSSAEGAREALLEAGYKVDQLDPSVKADLATLINGNYDFAFICMHGKGGEDGAIQGFLETIGIPYTGSNVTSSAICMDKSKAKLFYKQCKVPTPESMLLDRDRIISENLTLPVILEKLGGKVVVKVPTEGSSIGVYIVDDVKSLGDALDEAFGMSDEVLVEKYISGREFTCVVFSEGIDYRAFPVIEIIPKNASYDFESKYSPGGCKHVCPAEISEKVTKDIQKYAIDAYKALGCSGAARTDFLLEENGKIWALETNTVPGMTKVSLLPDAAAAEGISFPELCTMMVQAGLGIR